MKKTLARILCIAMVSAAVLTSCGKTESNKTADTAKADETKKNTEKVDQSKYEDPENLWVESDDEFEHINQMLDYPIDKIDPEYLPERQGGDITGMWLSDIMRYEMDMDNDPTTMESLCYRTCYSFRPDGTGRIYIFLGGADVPITYEVGKNGSITIEGERLDIQNAGFTVSEDGQTMRFSSDRVNCYFMRIGDCK